MPGKRKNGRLTIGLLTSLLAGDTNYEQSMWQGVYDITQERNFNLLVFAGDVVSYDSNHQYSSLRNIIYHYVDPQDLDGIIITTSTLSNYLSQKDFTDFCGQYSSIPLVSIGENSMNIPKSLIDNRKGMHDVVAHLIESHGKKRIAFIRGSEGNDDAKQRHEVYLEVLKEYKIAFDPNLVYNGNFSEPSGNAAIKAFVEERKVAFDAVVASNDQMAFGAMKELQKHGFRIPNDVAVTGFDNAEEAASTNPPLTTVAQPVYKQSRRGGELLLDLIEKKAIEKAAYLPTELVVRQSCGCLPSRVILAKMGPVTEIYSGDVRESFEKKVQEALSLIRKGVPGMDSAENAQKVQKLLGALYTEVFESGGNLFIGMLDELLHEAFVQSGDLSYWQDVVSIMRNSCIPLVRDENQRFLAENLFQQARTMVGELSSRFQAYKLTLFEKENAFLRWVIMNASANFEQKELLPFLARELPRLNIPSGLVSVFTDNMNPPKECEIFIAFQNDAGFDPTKLQKRFPVKEFVPKAFWSNRPQGFLITPLFYSTQSLGVAVLEIGTKTGYIYEAINSQLGSSIKASMLVDQSRESEKTIADRNARIETLIGPMLASIKAISQDVQDRMKQAASINELTRTSLQKVSATNSIIEKVATNISKMSEIISMIDEISIKVNLVALNASIESTHAGQYGSGFAVIAKEIKKLSDSTKRNAEEVSVTIQHVIKNIKESLVTGKESLESFQQQEKGVNDILTSLTAIASQMETLNSRSLEILKVMKDGGS